MGSLVGGAAVIIYRSKWITGELNEVTALKERCLGRELKGELTSRQFRRIRGWQWCGTACRGW